MIIHEETKGVHIVERKILYRVPIVDVGEGLAVTEHIIDSVVHGVVEQGGDVILIRTHVLGITVEGFSHLENTCCLAILLPKVFSDLGDCVNAHAVKAILGDKAANPVLEV